MDIDKLIADLRDFAAARDWEQHHSPKNLVMALSVEVAELMEHFQWLENADSEHIMESDQAEAVREEMADVLLYLLRLADRLEIDLAEAAYDKLARNAQKYPVKS